MGPRRSDASCGTFPGQYLYRHSGCPELVFGLVLQAEIWKVAIS